jgi:DNA uptake protein ComE-like DNA-binding protein
MAASAYGSVRQGAAKPSSSAAFIAMGGLQYLIDMLKGATTMKLTTLTAFCVAAILSTGAAFAQTTTAPKPTAPMAPATPAPRTTAATPTTMAAPAPTTAAVPAGTKVNLNTATAAQLDALPTIGKARSKVIITERAKSPFKDWSDFDTRTQHTSVNAGVKTKIKDLVTF